MPFIVRAGERLFHEVVGHGPSTVVVCHPLAFTGRFFRSFAEDLARDGWRVVLPDALGHGQSSVSDDPARYSVLAQADDVVAACDSLGVDRFSVVGYSMGGWLVTGVAARAPTRIDAVAVGGWDPVHGPPPALPVTLVEDVPLALKTLRDVPSSHHGDAAGVQHCFRALYDPLPPVPEQPALVLWAGADDPYRLGMEQTATEVGAPLTVVEGGHDAAARHPDALAMVADHLARWQ